MILIIDNYDSFTFNLYQLIGSIDPEVRVVRNDELRIDELEALHPDAVVISPGPGRPADAGVSEDAVRAFAGRVPLLGVCLGHQAICEVHGATITYARRLMHGRRSRIALDGSSAIFSGLPHEIEAARYHSLVADPETIPDELRVTARTTEPEDERGGATDSDETGGEIMAVEHRDLPVFGVQFHPESILTPLGRRMVENFLSLRSTDGSARSPRPTRSLADRPLAH